MRILIDCRCLQTPPPRGGVGVYAEQLMHALIARANQESRITNQEVEWILFANGLVDPRPHLPAFDAPNARWCITRWPNRIWSAGVLTGLPSIVYRLPSVDTVFLPNLNFLPPLPKRTRLVVTVHDLSFEHFADCFTWKQRLWHRAIRPRQLLARADAIIAVSETTKRDAVETYGMSEDKVRVVYPGMSRESSVVSREDIERTRARYQLPTDYILSLSEHSPRKNIDGLIAAFELLTPHASRLTPPVHLVIAGIPGSATRTIHRQITRSPARDRIHVIGPVSENEKRALLSRASCFVYPSLWEGFGFPPLEACVAGVPVVASTGGALPEILGDAALLVDPLDPAAIADAIARACTDDALRTELIARGRTRAARYRWEDAARKTIDVITGTH